MNRTSENWGEGSHSWNSQKVGYVRTNSTGMSLEARIEALAALPESWKRLLTHALKLSQGQVDDDKFAQTLIYLSVAHTLTGQDEEGIRQMREASKVYERLGQTRKQAMCLIELASLLWLDGQLDAAEETASPRKKTNSWPVSVIKLLAI